MKNKIDIVITMAGVGSRFIEAGYTMPKYMIEAKGMTLFEWSLESLKGFDADANQYIFVVLKDKNNDVEEFINVKCRSLNIKNYKIVLLNALTDGQATSALCAKRYWKRNNSLLIYNIDTYVDAGEMKSSDIIGDGFIPCFIADGNHWSFVKTDELGNVVEIREKQLISLDCTLGAYYFKTCELYENLYNEYYSRGEYGSEKYVAPLYNHLLQKGGQVNISVIDASKVHVLGTPNELNDFINE